MSVFKSGSITFLKGNLLKSAIVFEGQAEVHIKSVNKKPGFVPDIEVVNVYWLKNRQEVSQLPSFSGDITRANKFYRDNINLKFGRTLKTDESLKKISLELKENDIDGEYVEVTDEIGCFIQFIKPYKKDQLTEIRRGYGTQEISRPQLYCHHRMYFYLYGKVISRFNRERKHGKTKGVKAWLKETGIQGKLDGI